MKDQHSESSSSDAASAALTALAGFGIEHEVLDCDPELADTAVFCEHYGIPLSISANVIVAAGKSNPRQYAACVLLASSACLLLAGTANRRASCLANRRANRRAPAFIPRGSRSTSST